MAKPPAKKTPAFTTVLAKHYPGLLEKIQALIVEAERKFAGNTPESEGSFLWEHTLHTAALAFKLAGAEKRDPAAAVIAALFHDAGKFVEGRYHADDVPEEERAALLAEKILARSRMAAADRRGVVSALRALYNEKSGGHPLADLVHDADFLSKFGYLGVAAFFTKAALRGRTMGETIVRSLSKELTYAAALPFNMRTASARALAVQKSADSLSFYRSFLNELEKNYDLPFRIHTRRVRRPGRPGSPLTIRLVLPLACRACGGGWAIETKTVRGLKCETLEARAVCRGCGKSLQIAFCLPEVR